MIIEVKKLNAQKKYYGNFDFEYDAPQDKLILPLCNIEGKVKVQGTFEIYEDDAVGVNFKIKYLLVGQCSYCLADAKQEVEYESDVLFVPESDLDDYSYANGKIDLKVAIDDAILFSQPTILLCKADCEGIEI